MRICIKLSMQSGCCKGKMVFFMFSYRLLSSVRLKFLLEESFRWGGEKLKIAILLLFQIQYASTVKRLALRPSQIEDERRCAAAKTNDQVLPKPSFTAPDAAWRMFTATNHAIDNIFKCTRQRQRRQESTTRMTEKFAAGSFDGWMRINAMWKIC